MDRTVVLNGQWKRFALFVEKHAKAIFTFELGMVAGMLLALLVIVVWA